MSKRRSPPRGSMSRMPFLSVEGGFDPERLAPVLEAWPEHQLWDAPNMFFGGAHTVASGPRGVEGAGDPRRGGACAIIG